MIYLDNAATSFPKPAPVLKETLNTVSSPLGNPGRSGHFLSQKAAKIVFSAREKLALLCGISKPEQIVFCGGATAALNMAIFGVCRALRPYGIPLVITDVFEHNSVLRPLFALEKKGQIRLGILSPEKDGNLSQSLLLSTRPDVIVITARSNVTGHFFPLKNTLEALRKSGTFVIFDASQALGSFPCTPEILGADILCAPGHKGLMGMMGGGFLAFRDHCPILPEPILFGGSGNESFRREMPDYLPERLEAGTLPLPAIASMGAGADFLLKEGVTAIGEAEREKKKMLTEEILNMEEYFVYEPQFPDGPLLINHIRLPSEDLAEELEKKEILVRAGLHCAPLAHQYLGSDKTGAVRLSPGPFTTKREIKYVLDSLWSIK